MSDELLSLVSAIPAEFLPAVTNAFGEDRPSADRIEVVHNLLERAGAGWRPVVGKWIADLLSVETLVPDKYDRWRPLVHECMAFVASHISDSRLAPKIVQQVELPPDTPVEVRLGFVIAKTPGLQKLGQVLARTRGLSIPLRHELQKLENGISDVTPEQIRRIILAELGPRVRAYKVELRSTILSEASVSALMEFSWLNPTTGRREKGVFKVIKPHVPGCYAEDLLLLKDLGTHLSARKDAFGFASQQVMETLEEVRLLLEREVDFRSEQATLAEVNRVYRHERAHAPKPIPELCSDIMTAMSLERGIKVTDALRQNQGLRRKLAARIVEALIADPIFSPEDDAVFHADPHAGNLMYDEGRDELIVLDWALTGRLSREERRQVARLIVMMMFRDTAGVRNAILALSAGAPGSRQSNTSIITRCVSEYFEALPHACTLGPLDAMRLLDRIGIEGVRFPGTLVLMRKVLFTLDGVLNDVAGGEVRIDTVVTREFVSRWITGLGNLPAPLEIGDLIALQKSAFRYATGLWAWPS